MSDYLPDVYRAFANATPKLQALLMGWVKRPRVQEGLMREHSVS